MNDRQAIQGIREPIALNLREPIVLHQRQAIHKNDPLDWDKVYGQFDNYIKYAAKQVSTTSTSVIASAEDLYQEGLLLLWKCFEQYKYKDFTEFCYIFKASIWRQLRGLGRKFEFNVIDIEEAYDVGYSEDMLEEIYDEYRMKQVMDMLKDSPVAVTILTELLTPSNGTFKQCEMDMARKETIQRQGYRVNVPSSLEVKGIHIQRALNLSKELYVENLRLIRKIVYKVYSPDTVIKSYAPTSDELDEMASGFMDETTNTVYVENPALKNDEVCELVQDLADLISDELYEQEHGKSVVTA